MIIIDVNYNIIVRKEYSLFFQNERSPAEWTNRKELLQVALFVLGEKYV